MKYYKYQPAYPTPYHERSDGSVVQSATPGIDLYTYIATQAMAAILSRTDGGIFSPDTVAEIACEHTEALLKRIKQ